ncbi:hypothetical protein HK102_008615, partial [Quaeritorhiza haematococci]
KVGKESRKWGVEVMKRLQGAESEEVKKAEEDVSKKSPKSKNRKNGEKRSVMLEEQVLDQLVVPSEVLASAAASIAAVSGKTTQGGKKTAAPEKQKEETVEEKEKAGRKSVVADLLLSPPTPAHEHHLTTKDPLAHIRQPHSQTVYVIDDITANELDDGISIEPVNPLDSSSSPTDYWLHVHIADPTSTLVSPLHPLSLTSQIRGSSIYFPERHFPLIPQALTDKHFNLDAPGRHVVTFSARLDEKGEIVDYRVKVGVLESVKVVTYDDVDRVVDWGGVYGWEQFKKKGAKATEGEGGISLWTARTLELNAPKNSGEPDTRGGNRGWSRKDLSGDSTAQHELRLAQQITRLHHDHRVRNGALVQDAMEAGVHVKPYGVKEDALSYAFESIKEPVLPKRVNASGAAERFEAPVVHLDPHRSMVASPAHSMVAESMVIAGRVAAKYCLDRNIAVPYRGQVSFEEMYGLIISSATSSSTSISAAADEVSEVPESITPKFGAGLLVRLARADLSGGNTLAKWAQEQLFQGQKALETGRDKYTGVIEYFAFRNEVLPHLVSASMDLRPIAHSAMGIPGVSPVAAAAGKVDAGLKERFVGYLKATSPLRRFMDMIAHWQIKAGLLGDHGSASSTSSSGESKSLTMFSKEDVAAIAKRLYALEKRFAGLSSRAQTAWTLEWCRRREVIARLTGVDPCASSPAISSSLGVVKGETSFNSVGLPATELFGSPPTIWESNFNSHSAFTSSTPSTFSDLCDASPVYTCVILDPGSQGSTAPEEGPVGPVVVGGDPWTWNTPVSSPPRVLVVELGGFKARLLGGVGGGRAGEVGRTYKQGQVVRAKVSRIDPGYGILVLKDIEE